MKFPLLRKRLRRRLERRLGFMRCNPLGNPPLSSFYILQNLLGLIADEYERLDLSERDDRRASASCACL
jgi:hypothetical protein